MEHETRQSQSTTLISAIVCTYNRCEMLRETLRALKPQTLGGGLSLEILIVDNHSTDQTRAIVQEAAKESRWPIRYLFEPAQGLSHARNCGLRHAKGAYAAFTDDDTVPDEGWAGALARCFEETGADLIGGKVTALWCTPRPEWIRDDLLGPVIACDRGPTRARCMSRRDAFLGANFALRCSSAARYGAFDPALGRRGSSLIGGEDVELFERWLAAGASIVYEPTAIVQHKVTPERVTPEFYQRWFTDIGYTQGHQMGWKWHYQVSIVPLWRWGTLAHAGARYAWTRLWPSTDAARLRAELWWRFQRSFLQERLDHWRHLLPCRFAKAC